LKKYHTEQRDSLLAFFAKYPDDLFTIDELKESVGGISRSALYRNITPMAEQGLIRRVQKEGGRKFYYQYIGSRDCAGHLHLHCSDCGMVLHMNDKAVEAVMAAVRTNTDFDLDKSKTILLGHCPSCRV